MSRKSSLAEAPIMDRAMIGTVPTCDRCGEPMYAPQQFETCIDCQIKICSEMIDEKE